MLIYCAKSPDFLEESLLNGLRRLDFVVFGLSVNVGVFRPFRRFDFDPFEHDSLPIKAVDEVGVSGSVGVMHCEWN